MSPQPLAVEYRLHFHRLSHATPPPFHPHARTMLSVSGGDRANANAAVSVHDAPDSPTRDKDGDIEMGDGETETETTKTGASAMDGVEASVRPRRPRPPALSLVGVGSSTGETHNERTGDATGGNASSAWDFGQLPPSAASTSGRTIRRAMSQIGRQSNRRSVDFSNPSSESALSSSASGSSSSAATPAQRARNRLSWHPQSSNSPLDGASSSSPDSLNSARPPSSPFASLSSLASSAATSLLSLSFRRQVALPPQFALPAQPPSPAPDSPSSFSFSFAFSSPSSTSLARRLSSGSFDSILHSPVPRPATHPHPPSPAFPPDTPSSLTLSSSLPSSCAPPVLDDAEAHFLPPPAVPPSPSPSPRPSTTVTSIPHCLSVPTSLSLPSPPKRRLPPSAGSYPPHELLQKIISYLPPPASTPLSLLSTTPPDPALLYPLTLVNSAWYYAALEALWKDPHWTSLPSFEKWCKGVEAARTGRGAKAMTARTVRPVGATAGVGMGMAKGPTSASTATKGKSVIRDTARKNPAPVHQSTSGTITAPPQRRPRSESRRRAIEPSPYGHTGPSLLRRLSLRRTAHLVEYVRDEHLMHTAGAFGGVREMDLGGCRNLTDAAVTDFVSANPTYLVSLDLSHIPRLSDPTALALALFLTPPNRLDHLSLRGCGLISDAGVVSLAASLVPRLRSLDISGCRRVTDHGLAAVVRGAAAGGRLKEMRCSRLARLTRTAIKTACERLAATCPELSRMEFSVPPPPATQRDPTYYLLPAVALSGVREVGLRECGAAVTDGVATVLAEACGARLKGLELRGAHMITTAGVDTMLGLCGNLTRLDLRGCRRVDDLAVLSLALSDCAPMLEELDLGGTLVTDGALAAVEVGVGPRPNVDPDRVARAQRCAFPRLRRLGLSDLDRVSFEGVFAIARHIAPRRWAPEWALARGPGGVLEEVDVSGMPDLDPRRAAAIHAQGMPLPVAPLAGWVPQGPIPALPDGAAGAGGNMGAVAPAQGGAGAGTGAGANVNANANDGANQVTPGLVQRMTRPGDAWIEGLLEVPERVGSARGEYRWWCVLRGDAWKRVVEEAWSRRKPVPSPSA
ncbi:RNI-like protein [Gonapodya prolifera JEL478]|uniref:RNI-like protein n=1 Tax=Gonapodya prolifera (strain JEL478) TaxID=1344416 RepID=A0A139AQG1_GONPJ|nr:RNI-like protein [Gonapodya prolifera JEL478]|eukprot:KXS19001.1 RNI-like protein [Gonapodya prolifera JEL478]